MADGTFKLYDYTPSANARRVRFFLAEKGVTFESVQIDIAEGANLKAGYRAKVPSGLVPALETPEGDVLCETIAICRYVEALYPEPNLFGRDPVETATIEGWERRMEREGFLPVAWAFRERSPVFRGRAIPGETEPTQQIEEHAERSHAQATRFMHMLQARLAASDFVAGDRFTVADITAFVTVAFAKWIGFDPADAGEQLAGWYGQIKRRSAAKA